MKTIRQVAITLMVMLSVTVPCWARWGAIAYSRSSGATSGSWNCHSEPEAKAMALSKLNRRDGFVCVYVQNGWAAIARGSSGSWGWGFSHTSRAEAETIAMRKAGSGARVVRWIASGGQ